MVTLPVLLLLLAVPSPSPSPSPAAATLVRVQLETSAGSIEIEVDAARAPVTAANFLRYVDAGRYDGGRFHRTVRLATQAQKPIKIEVVQGGVAPDKEKLDFPAIKLETTRATGILHKDGTISMARGGPDSATSDFFICVGDQPALDFGGKRNPDGQGFGAFGRVVKGMDVVRRIHGAPADGESLTPPIVIVKAKRL
jgi:peptidyl-prolyl cis-trans isomerase A (cyclophilin A)